jgi:hypothetical protein
MSRKSIYLVVSSGFPNYGDELLASQWLRYLATTEPEADIWLDSPSPGNSQLLLGHLHPRVKFVDTLFRICWAAPSEDPSEVVDFAASAVRNPGVFARYALGIELLQQVDVFHILGGGYINTLWPRHLAFISAGAVLSARFDAISAITGVGLLPSAAPAGMLDELTGTFQVVDVRDTASRELFTSVEVSETGDDVLLNIDDHLYDQRESRSVMICAQADLGVEVDAVVETIRGTLNKWEIEGQQIGYVEAMPGWDRTVFERLEPDFHDIRFYPFVELWREGIPARRGQRWLTTRFHPHLVAAAAGAWGVAIRVNEDYYGVKHGSLIAQGSRWESVAAGELPQEVRGEPGFGPALSGLVARKQAVAHAIYGS